MTCAHPYSLRPHPEALGNAGDLVRLIRRNRHHLYRHGMVCQGRQNCLLLSEGRQKPVCNSEAGQQRQLLYQAPCRTHQVIGERGKRDPGIITHAAAGERLRVDAQACTAGCAAAKGGRQVGGKADALQKP